MKELWEEIAVNPRYLVSNLGNIYNMKRQVLLRPSVNAQGILKVGLSTDIGVQVTHTVARLVADAFVPNVYDPAIFNAPIHRDGDKINCRADNLDWRPRWFVVRYHQQFKYDSYRSILVPLQDRLTGAEYEGPYQAAVANGLLVADVIASYSQGATTFPTGQRFVNIAN